MILTRARVLAPAILALALFLTDLGTVIAHDHPAGPTCEVCKLAHHSPADLVRRISTSEPLRAAERIALPSTTRFHHPDLVVPQGRAPPAV